MISTAAIVTAVLAVFAGIAAVVFPIVGSALAIAAANILAFLIVLPLRLLVEGIHKLLHRGETK
jgi:hypothetical protein